MPIRWRANTQRRRSRYLPTISLCVSSQASSQCSAWRLGGSHPTGAQLRLHPLFPLAALNVGGDAASWLRRADSPFSLSLRRTQHLELTMDQSVVLLRLPEVMKRTGLGRTTIYKLVRLRMFPAPVQLSGRAVGWRAEQIDDWSRTRPTADFAADTQPRVVLPNARRRAA